MLSNGIKQGCNGTMGCHRMVAGILVAGASLLLGTSQAHAGFTEVKAPVAHGELGHAKIFSNAYGGKFKADGVNYSNGKITAERVADFGSGANDDIWSGKSLSVEAVASFAGYKQKLSVVDGDQAGSGDVTKLFSLHGSGMNVSGSAHNVNVEGGDFRFVRSGDGDKASSLASENFGSFDQMVTYRLTGPKGLDRYVLFFEDIGANGRSDWDFNDLVVQVCGVKPGCDLPPTAVPLPPAAWSALSIMAAGGLWKFRSRRLAGCN